MDVIDTQIELESFGITSERGFLSSFDPSDIVLPDALQPVRDVAMNLPAILLTGDVRRRLKAVPQPDMGSFLAVASDAQKRIAMVHYAFMVQSWVWGEPDAPQSLPANLAVPIWQLAKDLGQQPLLPYSGYVLDNWARIDRDGPVDLSNTHMIQQFLGGQDENWFVTIHVAIEARAGEALAAIPDLIHAAAEADMAAIEAGLGTISAVWSDINAIFDRMPERCEPYMYFNRVRPWIHGWKDNPALGEGLVYEGVAETDGRPQAFRGQTGSQSSIMPTMDALFAIGHAADPLRMFLDELHIYRPPAHRRFIDIVRARSTLRQRLAHQGNAAQKALYNECVEKLAAFRSKHLEYAASYINRQGHGGKGNDTEVGTGGTPFMKYLKKHRDEARKHLLD